MKTKKPRGSIFLLTIVLVIPLMLVVAGVAVDLAMLFATRSELHRSMDAASLAGAGHLGFDATVFPTVRDYAVAYAGLNPYSYGSIQLNRNDINTAGGDVVLGLWAGGTFTPSLDGTIVNAVLCRTTQSIPTYFLNMVGLTSLSTSAQSIAVSNPPNTAPGCVFPIGVTTCQFFNGPNWSSKGCGTAVTFATSSGKLPGTQAGTNTGAWINLTGTGQANPPYLNPAIAAAANGSCDSNPLAGQTVNANNGMIQNVVDTFESYFVPVFNGSSTYVVKDADGNKVYEGQGWEVYLPLIQTDCPPKDINQTYTIQTFAKFVFTQAINHGDCVVNNPNDGNSWPVCPPPMNPGGLPKDPNLRAIFGYFECDRLEATPTPIPTPRAALATRLRLVQ